MNNYGYHHGEEDDYWEGHGDDYHDYSNYHDYDENYEGYDEDYEDDGQNYHHSYQHGMNHEEGYEGEEGEGEEDYEEYHDASQGHGYGMHGGYHGQHENGGYDEYQGEEGYDESYDHDQGYNMHQQGGQYHGQYDENGEGYGHGEGGYDESQDYHGHGGYHDQSGYGHSGYHGGGQYGQDNGYGGYGGRGGGGGYGGQGSGGYGHSGYRGGYGSQQNYRSSPADYGYSMPSTLRYHAGNMLQRASSFFRRGNRKSQGSPANSFTIPRTSLQGDSYRSQAAAVGTSGGLLDPAAAAFTPQSKNLSPGTLNTTAGAPFLSPISPVSPMDHSPLSMPGAFPASPATRRRPDSSIFTVANMLLTSAHNQSAKSPASAFPTAPPAPGAERMANVAGHSSPSAPNTSETERSANVAAFALPDTSSPSLASKTPPPPYPSTQDLGPAMAALGATGTQSLRGPKSSELAESKISAVPTERSIKVEPSPSAPSSTDSKRESSGPDDARGLAFEKFWNSSNPAARTAPYPVDKPPQAITPQSRAGTTIFTAENLGYSAPHPV